MAEQRLGFVLPDALNGYYLKLGNLGSLNHVHNRLLAPTDWFIQGGKLVLMVENQAMMYWGIKAGKSSETDTAVYQGVNELQKTIDWHLETDRCSVFLLVMLHWQAAMGGLKWIGMSDEASTSVADHLEANNWQRISEFGGMVAFTREGRAACFLADCSQLYVGCRTESLFEKTLAELMAIGVGLHQL